MAGDTSKGTEGATVEKSDPLPLAAGTGKIREYRIVETGFGHADRVDARVRALKDGEPVPAGAEAVPEDTPVSGWSPWGLGRPDGVEVTRG